MQASPNQHPTLLNLLIGCFVALVIMPATLSAQELSYDELVQQALQERNRGEFSQAASTLNKARDLAAQTNEVDYLLGLLLAFQERFEEAEAVIGAALETYPDDLQLQLARARVLSFQSEFTEAGMATDGILATHPDNLEALILRANLHRFQRQFGQARRLYERVLSIDASNLEAMIGLHDTELGVGNIATADSWLSRAEARFPDHIDVATRRDRRINTSGRQHSIISGAGRSVFDTQSISRWFDRFAEYQFETSNGSRWILRGEHAHRFNKHDTMIEAGGVFAVGRGTYLEVFGAKTEDNDFLPASRIRVGGSFNLLSATENIGATTFAIRGMRSKFLTGNVSAINADFTHYLLTANAWIVPGFGVLRDENNNTLSNWSLGGHWQLNAKLRMGYTYTDAGETENSITTETATHHIYANVRLSDTFALRMDFSRHNRDNSYRRDGMAVSLNARF